MGQNGSAGGKENRHFDELQDYPSHGFYPLWSLFTVNLKNEQNLLYRHRETYLLLPHSPRHLFCSIFFIFNEWVMKQKFSPKDPSLAERNCSIFFTFSCFLGRYPQCVHQRTNIFRRSLPRRVFGPDDWAWPWTGGKNGKFCSIDFWKCIFPWQ